MKIIKKKKIKTIDSIRQENITDSVADVAVLNQNKPTEKHYSDIKVNQCNGESDKEEITSIKEHTEAELSVSDRNLYENTENALFNSTLDDFIAQYEMKETSARNESNKELATAIVSASVTFVLVVVVIITWFILK